MMNYNAALFKSLVGAPGVVHHRTIDVAYTAVWCKGLSELSCAILESLTSYVICGPKSYI